jgi:hypothetical protein
MMKAPLFLTLLLALTLGACTPPADDMGVVARVNGEPIALSELEFQHDLLHMDGVGTMVPSVEGLRREYGQILADLVVLKLVEQELSRRGTPVSDEELMDEEARVRADYPDDSFEQVLIEEYIDLASWRRQLRYDIARRKFFQTVLRPQVKVDYLEADTYYKQHIKDYRLPESYGLVVVRGPRKDAVERALATYRETGDISRAAQPETGVTVNEMTVSSGQLSDEWRDILTDLPPGEAGPVRETRGGWEALLLLRERPSRILNPTQAYPLVEQTLLEHKMTEAFEQWLGGRLATADIRISRHLLEKVPEADDLVAGVGAGPGSGTLQGAPLEEFGDDENATLGDGDGPPLGEEDEVIEEPATGAQ